MTKLFRLNAFNTCLGVAAIVVVSLLLARKYRRRQTKFVYLDQVALIKVGLRVNSDPEFASSLYGAIKSGAMKVVVSSWHLVETAHTTNIQKATRLADFIDSLHPLWLLERRNIQLSDMRDDFLRFAGVRFDPEPRITTRSAAIATLLGQKDAPRFDIPSRNFVQQWIRHPEQMQELEEAYRGNVTALTGLRSLRKTGRLTDEVSRRLDSAVLKTVIPSTTPAGVEIGPQMKADYLAQADLKKIPTLAIESAISEHEWDAQGGADRNTLIDKFHLISALPYVDEVISEDHFFRTVYPVAKATGHVKAKLLDVAEFLKRF